MAAWRVKKNRMGAYTVRVITCWYAENCSVKGLLQMERLSRRLYYYCWLYWRIVKETVLSSLDMLKDVILTSFSKSSDDKQSPWHPYCLTHWGWDKMDAILQTFTNAISLNENVWILMKIWLKFVLKGPISNIPALIQIMAWHRTGDKPLSEPMMTQFNDTNMHNSASMS